MEDNKKNKKLLILGLITISIFIIGASYAYFAVSTTNNFGTHTISGTMEDVGSVALTSTGNNISLNLSASDMMPGNNDIYYYGTDDGTPSTTKVNIKLADAVVTGSGMYDCDYTLNVTATGTNNMYTAFQGMSGKSTNQIAFGVGNLVYATTNGSSGSGNIYDFYTSNLFPVTFNGHLYGVSSDSARGIYGLLYVVNKSSVNQTSLAGTDITLTATVTSFTCTAIKSPYVYWNTLFNNTRYQNKESLLEHGMMFYIRTVEDGSVDVSNEVCGVIHNDEICVKPNDWEHVSTYKSQLEGSGFTCNSNYEQQGVLQCNLNSYNAFIYKGDGVAKGAYISSGPYKCSVGEDGTNAARCYYQTSE